jgi:hypothetical protein
MVFLISRLNFAPGEKLGAKIKKIIPASFFHMSRVLNMRHIFHNRL